jgi:hypothetical protein
MTRGTIYYLCSAAMTNDPGEQILRGTLSIWSELQWDLAICHLRPSENIIHGMT